LMPKDSVMGRNISVQTKTTGKRTPDTVAWPQVRCVADYLPCLHSDPKLRRENFPPSFIIVIIARTIMVVTTTRSATIRMI